MDKEILELLKAMQRDIVDIKEEQTKTNERLSKLEEGQQRIEKKLDITYDQVARTAEDITSIKDDLSTVENVTAKNWQDIIRLKAIK